MELFNNPQINHALFKNFHMLHVLLKIYFPFLTPLKLTLTMKAYLFLKLLYYCSITDMHFSPPLPPPPQTNPPPSLASTLPLCFVHVSIIVVPENPSLHCCLPPPLWLLLDYS